MHNRVQTMTAGLYNEYDINKLKDDNEDLSSRLRSSHDTIITLNEQIVNCHKEFAEAKSKWENRETYLLEQITRRSSLLVRN